MRCERRWQQSVGARVCAISPGYIIAPLARRELITEIGDVYRATFYAVAAKRMAPPEEIAGAAAFPVETGRLSHRLITSSDPPGGGVIATSCCERSE